MDQKLLAYSILVIMLSMAHLVQGVTGFGSIVLALPVLVWFFPLKTLVPALILVNFFQGLYFTVAERRWIDRKQALLITGFALVGLPIGYGLYSHVPTESLKLALGAFTCVVALWNLAGGKIERPLPDAPFQLLNLLGGLAQGALASGGPLIIVYAARTLPHKSAFRATLSLVWTVLNLILIVIYTATHAWTAGMVPVAAAAAPCVVLGTVLGIVLHEKIPQKPFRVLVFTLLLFTGLILLRPLLF